MEIAVLDASEAPTNDVVFAVAAVNQQVRDHWAPSYEVEPWPVVCYRDVKDLPADAFYLLVVTDKVTDGEWGDHDQFKTARVLFKDNPNWTVTLSHEVLEMCGNISVNLWLPHPSRPGFRLAREMCDPCQAGWYSIEVEVLGERRKLPVSDFVLAAYWVPGAPGPYNWLDTMEMPGEILPGGYQIVRTPEGVVDDLWYGQRGVPGPRGAMVRAAGLAQ